jgi:hypothetical protein
MLPEEFQTDPIEKSREVGRNHAPARIAENEVSTPAFSQNAVPSQHLVSELHVRRLLGRGRDASLGAYSAAIRDTAQKG